MVEHIRKELKITWRFVKNDIWATIIPGLIVSFVVVTKTSPSISESAIIFFKSLVYFFFYLYSFVLTNQLFGVEEDKINKPYRPLPSGLVSKRGVVIRSIVVSVAFQLIALLLNIPLWATLWIAVSLFHNFVGHKHWFTKNPVCMSLGIFAIIGAAWEMVTPMSPEVLTWAVVVSLSLGSTGVIQDFRDAKGDQKIGRHTLPLDIGDTNGRILSGIIALVALIFIFVFIILPGNRSTLSTIYSGIITLLFVFVPARLLLVKGARQDHQTYMLLLYLFNLMLLSGAVYL